MSPHAERESTIEPNSSGTPMRRGALQRLVGQFSRFTMVGVLATGIHYGIMTVMIQLWGFAPIPATSTGFITSATFNYTLNRRITFSSDATHTVALPKFLLVASVGLAFNALLVGLLTGPAAWHWFPAQLCASTTVLCWNFTINRIWTFS